MTAPDLPTGMADVLASALPAGISYDPGLYTTWNAREIAALQAERLAEAGYVLVHTAPDEATVERLARAAWDSQAHVLQWPNVQRVNRIRYRAYAKAVLAALVDTSAEGDGQPRHTADDATAGGEDG